jgi:hypothetical protein
MKIENYVLLAALLGSCACTKQGAEVTVKVTCSGSAAECADGNKASREMAGKSLADSRVKLDFSKLQNEKPKKDSSPTR